MKLWDCAPENRRNSKTKKMAGARFKNALLLGLHHRCRNAFDDRCSEACNVPTTQHTLLHWQVGNADKRFYAQMRELAPVHFLADPKLSANN